MRASQINHVCRSITSAGYNCILDQMQVIRLNPAVALQQAADHLNLLRPGTDRLYGETFKSNLSEVRIYIFYNIYGDVCVCVCVSVYIYVCVYEIMALYSH